MDTFFLKTRRLFSNDDGFTLIELVSVMIIMGVLSTSIVHRFDLLTSSAEQNALNAGVAELNVRESLVWTNVKLSTDAWPGDEFVWDQMKFETDLGGEYTWLGPGPTRTGGGTIIYESLSLPLARQPSTSSSAAKWR